MLRDVLQQLIDRKLTTAHEIGELAGAAPSTVYRWLRGESEPSAHTLGLLVRHLPSAEAQSSLLAWLTASTAWRLYRVTDSLDVNQDGAVDANDAIDATIAALRTTSDVLSQIRETSRQRPLGEPDSARLIQELDSVIRRCVQTQRILADVCQQRAQRPKARPLTPAAG